MRIYEIINQLKNTPSINDKLDILESHKNNMLLKRIFQMVLDKTINFGIKTIDDPMANFPNGTDNELSEFLDFLEREIIPREITGDAARHKIGLEIDMNLHPEDQKIALAILRKDIDCGVNSKLFNRVFTDAKVNITAKVQKCEPYSEKLFIKHFKSDKLFADLKMDAARGLLIAPYNNDPIIVSSNGKIIHGMSHITENVRNMGIVVDGELTMYNPSSKCSFYPYHPRTVSNGILNKAIRNTISDEEALQFRFVIWDIIPIEDYENDLCEIPFWKRKEMVQDFVKQCNDNIHCCPSWEVSNTYQYDHEPMIDIKNIFQMVVNEYIDEENHLEGIIIKDSESIWKPKRIKDQLKFKIEIVSTVRVTDINLGDENSKYAGKIGSLVCQSEDGKLIVSVSGLKDDERDYPHEYYLGKLIDIKHNGVIQDGTTNTYSVFLPRIVEIREDKDKADTLEEIKRGQ